MAMKNNYGGLDTSIMIIQITEQDRYFLKITRTVDFDGIPFKDGMRWNREPLLPITEVEAMDLFHHMGVPIKVQQTL
jgi:hypothetical protein